MATVSPSITRGIRRRQSRMLKLLDSERFLASAMLLPAVVYIVLLVGIPLITAILFSFSDATMASPQIDNLSFDTFGAVLNDPVFRRSLGNSIGFTIISQASMVVLGNVLALALMKSFPGKWFVRLLILLPWATPIAIGSIGWLWMYDSVYSPIDWIFRQIGLLGMQGDRVGLISRAPNMYWLGQYGPFSVILVQIWRMLPMSTVILMAGLSSIPQDVKDAAEVDGVGFWRTYFQVTIPLIRPIILVAFLFGVIFTFTDMTIIHVLTRGSSDNSTQVLASYAYYKGIDGGNLSQGAATAIFMLPVLLGLAMILLRIARRSEVV